MYSETKVKKPINRSAVARIVIWSVVLLILLGLLIWTMLCEEGSPVFGFGSYRYEDAHTYTVGEGKISERITALDVDWIDGRVKVIPTDGQEVIITETNQGDKEALRLRWKVEEGKLTVKYCESGHFMGFKLGKGKELTLEIPRDMLSAMEQVKLDLVSAELTVSEVTAQKAELCVVSGKINVTGTFDALDMETVSGNIKMTGVVQSMEIEGVSAAIDLTLREAAKHIEVETVSGNVTLRLPESIAGFEATLDAVSGNVKLSGFEEATQRKDYGRYGDGSLKIKVDAISGGLKIEKYAAD